MLVVVSNTILWENSWLDCGLAGLVSPLALKSVSLWWLWGSFLSASGGEISGADWLAVGGDPLIAGWKLGKMLKSADGTDLDIISNWPWAIVSTNLSAVRSSSLSVTVQSCAFWKMWGTSIEFLIVWLFGFFFTFFFGFFGISLDEPVLIGVSTDLSALDLSTSSIWTV